MEKKGSQGERDHKRRELSKERVSRQVLGERRVTEAGGGSLVMSGRKREQNAKRGLARKGRKSQTLNNTKEGRSGDGKLGRSASAMVRPQEKGGTF